MAKYTHPLQKKATTSAIVCVLSISIAGVLSTNEGKPSIIETVLLIASILATIVSFILLLVFATKYSLMRKGNTNSASRRYQKSHKRSIALGSNIKIPTSKKKQLELATEILANIEVCINLANKADNVSLFVDWFNEAVDGFSTLMKLEKVNFSNPPSLDYYRLKEEFQWHLCDAIARAKEATVSDIKKKYRNSHEFQVRAAESFECDINSVRDRFSHDTAEFADKSIVDVNNIVGVGTPVSASRQNNQHFSEYGSVQACLAEIDLMEGHAFEHWCANLLANIGYSSVSVTQGSGDQGVDILAQKDGIKYAIQCKCYSKDLGNSPIQEVNAGKSIYHCQIGAVITNRYFTKGAQDAAAATGILLWDRDWITKAIEDRNRKLETH